MQAAVGIQNRNRFRWLLQKLALAGRWLGARFSLLIYFTLAKQEPAVNAKCEEKDLFEFMPRDNLPPEWFRGKVDWSKVRALQQAIPDLTQKLRDWTAAGSQICCIGTTKRRADIALRELIISANECQKESVELAGASMQNLSNIANFWDTVKIDDIQLKREVFGAAVLIRDSFEPQSFQEAVIFAEIELTASPERFHKTLSAWKETRSEFRIPIQPKEFREDYFRKDLSDALMAYHDFMKNGFPEENRKEAVAVFLDKIKPLAGRLSDERFKQILAYGNQAIQAFAHPSAPPPPPRQKYDLAIRNGQLVLVKVPTPEPAPPPQQKVPSQEEYEAKGNSDGDESDDDVFVPTAGLRAPSTAQEAHQADAISRAVHEGRDKIYRGAEASAMLKSFVRMISEDNLIADNITEQILPPNLVLLKTVERRSGVIDVELVFKAPQETTIREVGVGAPKVAKGIDLSLTKTVRGKFDLNGRSVVFEDHQLVGKRLRSKARLTGFQFNRVGMANKITISGKLDPVIGSEQDFEYTCSTAKFQAAVQHIKWPD